MTLHLGVLSSNVGLTLDHLLRARKRGDLDADIRVLVSNNSKAGVMEIARSAGVPAFHISSRTHPSPRSEQIAIGNVMRHHDVEVILLAGWVKRIHSELIGFFPGRIINIH